MISAVAALESSATTPAASRERHPPPRPRRASRPAPMPRRVTEILGLRRNRARSSVGCGPYPPSMVRRAGCASLLTLFLLTASTATAAQQPHFSASVSMLSKNLRAEMAGVFVASRVPSSAQRTTADRSHLLRLRRSRAPRKARGQPRREHDDCVGVPPPLRTAVPDPQDRAHRSLPGKRLRLDRGGQHLCFNCRPWRLNTWSQHSYDARSTSTRSNTRLLLGNQSQRRPIPYLDRSTHRRGMAYELGARSAFDRVGARGRSGDHDYHTSVHRNLGSVTPHAVQAALAARTEFSDLTESGHPNETRRLPR